MQCTEPPQSNCSEDWFFDDILNNNKPEPIRMNNIVSNLNTSISPNPSNGRFTISINENTSSEIFVYNNLGQLIHQETLRSSSSQIDLSAHSKGIYFLKVQSVDKIYTEKIVVH